MSRNSSTTGKITGTPFSRRSRSASRSGSPGIRGPFVPGAGLVAECSNVVVDLTLESITFNESIDFDRAKEMADSFADAALGSFLPESKGRCKRAPIRPTEHAAQHVNHDGQGVALMSSAFTIGT